MFNLRQKEPGLYPTVPPPPLHLFHFNKKSGKIYVDKSQTLLDPHDEVDST